MGSFVKSSPDFDHLSDQDKTFIMIYTTNGFDHLAAYKATHPNASLKSCHSSACHLKQSLKPYIQDYMKQRYEALEISAEHIIQQLAEMAFSAKEDEIYNSNVKLKALDLMQKQLGLQTKNVKAEAEVNAAVTFVDDLKPDEDKSE